MKDNWPVGNLGKDCEGSLQRNYIMKELSNKITVVYFVWINWINNVKDNIGPPLCNFLDDLLDVWSF